MRLPTPQQYGLPEKFEKWRPNQEAALEFYKRYRGKRGRVTCMPTGNGKSAINVAEALDSGLATCIVTQDLGLMKQYMDDFQEIGMVSLMGRDRYECGMKDDFTCQDGYAARCPYKGTMSCPSTQAEVRARLSPLVVTNYAKWTSSKKYGQGMDHFQQVIFDEGDVAGQQLATAVQVELNHSEIEDQLSIDFPKYKDAEDIEHWKLWCKDAKLIVEDEIRLYQVKIGQDAKAGWVKHYVHMRNLLRRLSLVSMAKADNWVVDHQDKGYVFDPIRPGMYAEAYLLLRVPNIIFTSATIRPKSLTLSGLYKGNKFIHHGNGFIETEHYVFQEYDSDFDVRDCPIYYCPTQHVDVRHPNNQMLWLRLDQWLAKRDDRKNIIHTVSYARKEEIIAASRYSNSMLFNERGEPTTKLVQEFKDGPVNCKLVSPTVGRGYDFSGVECESGFMCKIPFEPPSKIVKAREEDDKEYRGYKAIQKIEQAAGRHVRFRGDRGDFLIPDDNMKWFKPQNDHLASRNFNRRYKYVEVLPPPLKKM